MGKSNNKIITIVQKVNNYTCRWILQIGFTSPGICKQIKKSFERFQYNCVLTVKQTKLNSFALMCWTSDWKATIWRNIERICRLSRILLDVTDEDYHFVIWLVRVKLMLETYFLTTKLTQGKAKLWIFRETPWNSIQIQNMTISVTNQKTLKLFSSSF